LYYRCIFCRCIKRRVVFKIHHMSLKNHLFVFSVFFSMSAVAQSNAEVKIQLNHSSLVDRAKFSADGKSVITLSAHQNEKFVWDVRTGRLKYDKPDVKTLSEFDLRFSDEPRVRQLLSKEISIEFGSNYVLKTNEDTLKLWDINSEKNEQDTIWYGIRQHSYKEVIPPYSVTDQLKIDTTWVINKKLLHEILGFKIESQTWRSKLIQLYPGAGNSDGPEGGQYTPQHIGSIALSPDRNFVASYNMTNGEVRVWETLSGKLKLLVKNLVTWGGTYSQTVKFSADGRKIILANSRTIKGWDIATGSLWFNEEIEGLRGEVFVHDGKNNRMIVGTDFGITWWKIGSNEPKKQAKLFWRDGAVAGHVALHPGGRLVLVSGARHYDETAPILFDLDRSKKLFALETKFSPPHRVGFDGSGKKLVIAADSTVKFFDLTVGKVSAVFPGWAWTQHLQMRQKTYGYRFTSDEKQFVTINRGGTNPIDFGDDLKLWNLTDGKLITTLNQSSSPDLGAFDMSPDGNSFVVGNYDSASVMWQTMPAKPLFGFEALGDLKFSGDGKYVISKGKAVSDLKTRYRSELEENTIRFWDATNGHFLKKFNTESEPICFTISPDDRIIATLEKNIKTGKGYVFNFYDYQNGSLSRQIEVKNFEKNGNDLFKEDGVEKINFSPDGTYLIAQGWPWEFVYVDLKSGKLIDAFSVSFDGKQQAHLGKNNQILLYKDGSSTETWRLDGHKFSISSIEFSHDGTRLVSSDISGNIILWDLTTGKALVSLFIIGSLSNDFFLIVPEGFYMGSKDALNSVHFLQNSKVHLFDQFDLQYNRPDLVLGKIGYASPELLNSYKKAYEKRIQKLGFSTDRFEKERSFNVPELTLKSDDILIESTIETMDVAVEARDEQYLLERLHVYVNGVPAYGAAGMDLKSISSKTYKGNIKIQQSVGKNVIELFVVNEKGVQSLKEQFETTYITQQPTKPVLHIVAIGVSEYRDKKMNLRYAAKDGQDLLNVIGANLNLYSNVITYPLLNQNATKAKIQSLRESLKRASVNDVVMIFISGHGILDKKLDYYLGTHDVDFAEPAKRGLSYSDLENLLESTPARQKLLMIDACHSGEVDKESVLTTSAIPVKAGQIQFRNVGSQSLTSKVGLENSYELSKLLFTDLRHGSGATIISAAGGTEFALEGQDWQNGVFTYALISGVKEMRADLNGDGEIWLSEIQQYLYKEVQELTNGKQTPTSRIVNLVNDWRIR
jgi:WD40 repeat protein